MQEYDPITLEILWERLITIVDEGAVSLRNTAFSLLVREGNDFAIVLLDPEGNAVAQNRASLPSFTGTIPPTVKHVVKIFRDTWQPGDVVIKGANALDYESRTAGVIVGGPNAGTTGKIMPYVVGTKAYLVIPVGLEKQVAGRAVDIANKMREPVESLNQIPSMFLLTGHIVTEIEAMNILADVSAFQAAAGGIGGAEGSVRLICRGPRKGVEKAIKLTELIQGEPPFVK